VINLSLEFTPQVNRCAQIVGVCDAVHKAIQHGVVVIAAAGNHHRPSVAFPARAPGAIAVGATTYRSCLADYSDYGKGLDLVAPGGGVDTALGTGDGACDHTSPGYGIRQFSLNPTAASNGNYHKFGIVGLHGTSMSAAHVSGVAAMMRAVGWQPDAIESRLEGCARQVGDPTFYGAGILDAAKSSWIGACP